ncbi:MAG: hypothetical protein ACPGOV_07355 [Magnetovibrionaceae bacterium]
MLKLMERKSVLAGTLAEMVDAIDRNPGCPLQIESPRAASGYIGAMVWVEMTKVARNARPDADLAFLLDCGEAPGDALSAIRHGAEAVRLDARDDVFRRVQDIGRKSGCKVLS